MSNQLSIMLKVWFKSLWFREQPFADQFYLITDPLRKASFEVGSGLKLFPLQILRERLHLRLELV